MLKAYGFGMFWGSFQKKNTFAEFRVEHRPKNTQPKKRCSGLTRSSWWNGLNGALQVKLKHFNEWSGMIYDPSPIFELWWYWVTTTALSSSCWSGKWCLNQRMEWAHVLGAINATSKRQKFQKMWVFRWQQWSQKDVNVFADLTSLSSLKPYHSFANYFLDCIDHIHNCSGTISYITCHMHNLFWKNMFFGTEES